MMRYLFTILFIGLSACATQSPHVDYSQEPLLPGQRGYPTDTAAQNPPPIVDILSGILDRGLARGFGARPVVIEPY